MKFTDFLIDGIDPGLAPNYDPKNAPIRKAQKLWSQVSDLLVDIADELYDAQKRHPQDEGIKRAIWYLENDEYGDLSKELRALRDR